MYKLLNGGECMPSLLRCQQHGHHSGHSMHLRSLCILFAAMVSLVAFEAQAQPGVCSAQGWPDGPLAACAQPSGPAANTAFAVIFTGATCVTSDSMQQFSAQLTGNVYSIFYDYVPPSICFGLPPPPRRFTTHISLPAGDYVVRLLERSAPSLPFPPFDPGAFTVADEFPISVRGTPAASPVPVGGLLGWAVLGLGLLAMALIRLRSRADDAIHTR